MKKVHIILALLIIATPIFALGRNDGSSKAHSIDFDWDKVFVQEPGAFWYRVAVTPVFELQDPELLLTLTNLSTDSATLSLHATMDDNFVEMNYKMAGGDSRTRELETDMLAPHYQYIYLTLTSDQKVSLSASLKDKAASDVQSPTMDAESTTRLVRGNDGVLFIERGDERYTLTGARL
jgi:hypothetical protein